jgi:hypothetical protein
MGQYPPEGAPNLREGMREGLRFERPVGIREKLRPKGGLELSE